MFRIYSGPYWDSGKENGNYCLGLKVYGFRDKQEATDQVFPSAVLLATPSGLG